jgi:hypothetical protein
VLKTDWIFASGGSIGIHNFPLMLVNKPFHSSKDLLEDYHIAFYCLFSSPHGSSKG